VRLKSAKVIKEFGGGLAHAEIRNGRPKKLDYPLLYTYFGPVLAILGHLKSHNVVGLKAALPPPSISSLKKVYL